MLRKSFFALPLVAVLGFFFAGPSTCLGQSLEREAIENLSSDEAVEVDEKPIPANLREIQMDMGYPKEAKEKNIEGTVIAKVLVDKSGKYERHEIVQEGNPILAAAVEKHLAKLEFSPAKKDGKALKFWVTIPFKFKMS